MIVVAAIVLVSSVFIQVPANNVAVVTAFGKPVSVVNNGLHLLPPWDQT